MAANADAGALAAAGQGATVAPTPQAQDGHTAVTVWRR